MVPCIPSPTGLVREGLDLVRVGRCDRVDSPLNGAVSGRLCNHRSTARAAGRGGGAAVARGGGRRSTVVDDDSGQRDQRLEVGALSFFLIKWGG